VRFLIPEGSQPFAHGQAPLPPIRDIRVIRGQTDRTLFPAIVSVDFHVIPWPTTRAT
jgi:hypothetical protein